MEPRLRTHSTVIAAPPEKLYGMISDITRMGEWSPVCKKCWWDDPAKTGLGAWFRGRNVSPERTWETHCEVVTADPGKEFAFRVEVNKVRWGFTFQGVDDGTAVTESWDLGPASLEMYQERLGDGVPEFLDRMEKTAVDGMTVSLAALKAEAESAG